MSATDNINKLSSWKCQLTEIDLWLNHGTVIDSHSCRVNIKALFNALIRRENFLKNKQRFNVSMKDKIEVEMVKHHKLIQHLCEFDYNSKASILNLDGNGLFLAKEAESHRKICNVIFDLLDPFLLLPIATDLSKKMKKCQICISQQPNVKMNIFSFATVDYDSDFPEFYVKLCTEEGVKI